MIALNSNISKLIGKLNSIWRWQNCKWITLIALTCLASGCIGSSENEVVVYSALDREFSKAILDDFQNESKVAVLPKFDVESVKTVGLTNAIINEKNRPRCDLFWNNEILHTLRLKKMGLLEPFECSTADGFPADYRSKQNDWYGFAARARVLIVNTEKLPREQWPDSINDLVDPKWTGKVAIAKPLFGTTATHAAVLFSKLGDEKATDFFQKLKRNASVLSGNKQVALSVAKGTHLFGLTDTDDAIIEKEKGMPIEIIFPDQLADQMGTLFVPNTLCVIKGGPNTENAKRLAEFLLSKKVEIALSKCASAQFPVNPAIEEKSRIEIENVKWMQVDFEAAAEKWETAAEKMTEIFQTSD